MIDFENIDLETAQEYKLHLERMLDSEGWTFVEDLVEERLKIRRNELAHARVQSIEEMAKFNYLQGGVSELALIPMIIKQAFADLTEQVRQMQDELAEEGDHDNG